MLWLQQLDTSKRAGKGWSLG